jgi:MSHA biogenesis protein MshP
MLPPPRSTPDRRWQRPPRGQRGLSSLLVIALLALLGGLTTYAVGLVTSVHGDLARELSFARATQAAEAGLDWGRFRISNGAAPQCAASQTLNALPGTLQAYRVTVRCVANGPYTESGQPRRIFRLTATACNLPAAGLCPNAVASADYVERTVSTLVER